jgi:hypothetical protein
MWFDVSDGTFAPQRLHVGMIQCNGGNLNGTGTAFSPGSPYVMSLRVTNGAAFTSFYNCIVSDGPSATGFSLQLPAPDGSFACDPFIATNTIAKSVGCNSGTEPTGTFTLSTEATADGDCQASGPDESGCCTDAGDLTAFVDATGDFDLLADTYTAEYDPTGIDSDLSGDAAYSGQFQWRIVLHDGSILYFGCLEGAYYVGIDATSDIYDCFNAMTPSTLFKIQTISPVSVSCSDTQFATVTLVADGGTGCSGTFILTVYR